MASSKLINLTVVKCKIVKLNGTAAGSGESVISITIDKLSNDYLQEIVEEIKIDPNDCGSIT